LKLVTFEVNGASLPGVLVGSDFVLPFEQFGHELIARETGLGAPAFLKDILSLLEEGPDGLDFVREGLAKIESGTIDAETLVEQGVLLPVNLVRLKAPIARPSKIVAIGLNYMDHCREQNVEPPTKPLIFTKFTNSVIGPDDLIEWDPTLTSQVDYEAELGVVIGTTARRVRAEKAHDYIAGYVALNDVSARDLQFSDGQWVRGKSLDTFCPMGPALVTRDEVRDANNLFIRCRLNDQMLQDSSTAEMIFKIPELIEFITQGITLYPGDVIATGTPHGVGVFRAPQVFMKDGDVVTVEIENIGELRNTCSTDK
jgi:2-keto-4-pentenoate hydratase/2-oxohepta-3-ene-1,7-dioic acid hydratase in catechol pathway